eukprot:scaffold79484_cov13-Tisochrysis_lutea.AAC.1
MERKAFLSIQDIKTIQDFSTLPQASIPVPQVLLQAKLSAPASLHFPLEEELKEMAALICTSFKAFVRP